MLEPLLDEAARERPSWISWKAHVRLAAFVLRFSYNAQRDGVLCDRLINDFDQKFDLAYLESHRKPKHHCIKHLRKYLILYGPFRNYTCFTGEGFLSLIKPMFEDCKYKSAAYTVGRRWAMRHFFRQKTGTARMINNMTTSSDVLVGSALQAAAASSPLLHRALAGFVGTPGPAVRFLREIKRGRLHVSLHDWIYACGGAVGWISR